METGRTKSKSVFVSSADEKQTMERVRRREQEIAQGKGTTIPGADLKKRLQRK